MNQPIDISSCQLTRQRRSLDIFICMVVVSLLLHLAASVIFILPGRFTQPGAAPVFLELQNLTEAPAPAMKPVAEEAVASKQQAPVQEAAPELPPAVAAATENLEKSVSSSLRRAVQTPEAVHESSIGLGMISGHFASFADGVSLKDDIRVYYFELMRRINEVWWTSDAAQGSFTRAASVNLAISRDGKIVACELLESSGNREQDRALLAVIKTAEPLPPLPQSFHQRLFNAPVRFVPPLRLMLPGFANKGKLSIKHGE